MYEIVLIGSCFALTVLFGIMWVKQKKTSKKLQEQITKLENAVHSQQLIDIDYKLNPHLFKNVLNTIQSHAYQTYHSLNSLSNVLDYILYESDKKYVSPEQEINFALNLIEIYKVKLSPLFDLKIKKNIHENELLYKQNLIAPFLCIDLIENAFKHADIQSNNSFIAISFEFKNNTFSLTVANKISKKAPLKKEKQGFGSKTITQRLDIIYKDSYKLDKFIENDVYIAHLKIDLLEHKTKMLATRR